MGCASSAAAATLQTVPDSLAYLGSLDIFSKENKAKPAILGQLLLEGKPKAAPGSFAHAGSFDYALKQEVVKGLTLEVCHKGELTPELETAFTDAVSKLEAQGASVICGCTGFMMWFQRFIRSKTKLPVILSPLAVLPSIRCSYSAQDKIAIFTDNRAALDRMKQLLHDECSVELDDGRFLFVGCEDIPGFENLTAGHGDEEKMTKGLVEKAQKILEEHPKVRAFMLESTELPPSAQALRKATFRPVFGALTLCDFYINSHLDNPRFGIKDWDDAKSKPLLSVTDLVTVPGNMGLQIYETSKQKAASLLRRCNKAKVSLGVIRLDYHYPPAPGDVDHPGSYAYEVHYHMVKGLTFEMCQSGKLTPEVEAAFLKGITELEAKGVSVITGDCGFMMWLQELARKNTKLPVIMSSLATLPAITSSYHSDEQIAIFTANGQSLLSMEKLIKDECGVDTKDKRYIFIGCEEVPGFEAVALGEKVDVRKVTPGIVKKAQDVLAAHPKVRAMLMECTELPPYSDAVRHMCGVPVFDAITACDFYISSHVEHPMMKA